MSNNSIKSLPGRFSNLKNLKKLELWNCALTEIETIITQLTSLELLTLSENNLHDGWLAEAETNITHLTYLQILDLDNCGLTEKPKELSELTFLHILSKLKKIQCTLKSLHTKKRP